MWSGAANILYIWAYMTFGRAHTFEVGGQGAIKKKDKKMLMVVLVNAARRDTIVEQAWRTGCNKKTTQSS